MDIHSATILEVSIGPLHLTNANEVNHANRIDMTLIEFLTFLSIYRNLTRGGTIMISRDYLLVKNKLNYSFE